MNRKVLLLAGVAVSLAACSGDTTGTVAASTAASTYFALVLNQHAINMSVVAPANTMSLTAVPVTANGDTLARMDSVTFRSTDSSVTVAPTGIITANFVTPPGGTLIIASLQQDNITHVDTALVKVTATIPPALATFSLGDTASGSVGTALMLPITATDVDNNPVTFSGPMGDQYVCWIKSSNGLIAYTFNAGRVDNSLQLGDTGHVTVYTTAWMYGTPVQDSLKLFVSWAMQALSIIDGSRQSFLNHGTQILGVGAVVNWFYVGNDSLNIVFDDSTQIDSALSAFGTYSGTGNIHFPPGLGAQARSFPVAGTYRYHNAADTSAKATIFILPNPKP